MYRYIHLSIIVLFFITACGGKKKQSDDQLPIKLFEPPNSYPEFNGSVAYEYLKHQTAFGPRVPGSKAHEECLAFLKTELENSGASVRLQSFNLTGYEGQNLSFTNIIASFPERISGIRQRRTVEDSNTPELKRRIVLCAHWDSRPRADGEQIEANKTKSILGANDGASGVAVLLSLAKLFKNNPPPVGIDLVLFDGEDYGKEGESFMYCLGAKYFASNMEPNYKPLFGILLDLVGDKNARFLKEGHSVKFAPDIVDLVWSSAAKLGVQQFVVQEQSEILDDHYSLNTVGGIRTIDIIDGELVGNHDQSPERKYWHTLQDTPDKCSPKTLENVGKVLTYLIYGLLPA